MSNTIVSYAFERVLSYCSESGHNFMFRSYDGDKYILMEVEAKILIIIRPVSKDDDTLEISLNDRVLYKGTDYYDIKRILELFKKEVK